MFSAGCGDCKMQVLLMLPNDARNKLQKLKQQLQDVRKATANMHGVGKAVGGSLLQGEASCLAAAVLSALGW